MFGSFAGDTVIPLGFEKDDDSNGHIDFISAAAVKYLVKCLE